MFVDDTNALVKNEDSSIESFWECLQTYCKASGSVINHNKTGIRTSIQLPPNWLLLEGCKVLGILMRFRVSLRKKWLHIPLQELATNGCPRYGRGT